MIITEIGRAETFGDIKPCKYGLGISTEIDFKIQGGQRKNLY